jgi:hypothetical protein
MSMGNKTSTQRRAELAKRTTVTLSYNEWQAMNACEIALKLIRDHLTDLQRSNPGYLSKMVLQDYQLWANSHAQMDSALAALKNVRESQLSR